MKCEEQRVTRRTCLKAALAAAATGGLGLARSASADAPASYPTARETFALRQQGKKIPVIFDTDIGGDIDDTWALAMLLKCPEFEIKLVAADSGNAIYRARLMAKLLEVAGRTDVPIAVGLGAADRASHQSKWIEGYSLDRYPGTVHQDGVDAIVQTIKKSADPVTVVCIGAVPNIAEALRRAPDIVRNSRFVGMHGAIRRGYGNSDKPVPEANVRSDPAALRTVFAAPWDCTITPLDTCGIVALSGAKYQRVYDCQQPLIRALMENYRVWITEPDWLTHRPDPAKASTTLFDTVAVYLAMGEDLVNMEDLPVRVTDDGMTVVDQSHRPIHCAMSWKDLGAFEDLLVERLVSG
ncbi:MAG: nucleoside hydrolase [Planctomycetes bacterium]|nr:nucleoside hydrolase [Planctomycetota bacterium]